MVTKTGAKTKDLHPRKKTALIILAIAAILYLGIVAMHVCDRVSEKAAEDAERQAILRMNNKLIEEHNALYQYCEQITKEHGIEYTPPSCFSQED